MRSLIRQAYSRQLRRYPAIGDQRSAMVFAPHPDDETLGCGGTIARRRRNGMPVTVVVMTDGRVSHAHLVPADQLAGLRASEVRQACNTLGVAEQDVFLLGYQDGQLAISHADAVERVSSLLRDRKPEDVFVPHRADFPADHRATYTIVAAALTQAGIQPNMYEYPVWFWYHWPWVPLLEPNRRESLRIMKRSLLAGLGLRFMLSCNCAQPLEDVRAVKCAALQAHATQMSRLLADSHWPTLYDVGQGEFVRCFFGELEPFRKTSPRIS
ncbi:MAG TPA: PIG-L deacetylase family protein [Roseiflexaceae bacterium]|nr:PIG-L deacetylase family protein [Roseiflexaceae bacterium]